MRSPADMGTIQIDITNACNKACSNCTRFCGNHRKPFYMDYETFTRAVESLEGFEGVIGVMGGEPTLHPEFERFVLYLQNRFGKFNKPNRMIYPQNSFIKEIRRRECESYRKSTLSNGSIILRNHGVGLWSNMGKTYGKYYEMIQDTFQVQYLNDHINPSYHQPGLFSRKDLGITDKEWIPMRNACWIQNEWSATVTPKGAFFCEIAGALDMLFDGPGGWKIEPGWWKRKPEDFSDQLHWCEICGFALDTFMRNADDEQDDVSPTLYEKLKSVDSPRMKSGRTNLVKIENGIIAEKSRAQGKHFTDIQPYIESYEDRFNESNSELFVNEFDTIYIEPGKEFGKKFNNVLNTGSKWKLFTENRACVEEIQALISSNILNPGTLHKGEDCYLFSKNAYSLRQLGFDRIAHCESFEEIESYWEKGKVINLEDVASGTKVRRAGLTDERYIIWGTGMAGRYLADAVIGSGGTLVFAVDKNKGKGGKEFFNVKIVPPEYLAEHIDLFDKLLVGHFTRFDEIKAEAIGLGVSEERIKFLDEI